MADSSSILAPYPADFKPPSVSTGFFRPTASNAVAGPIFTGSTKQQLNTPLPGAVVTINEFGLDETELEWSIQTDFAAKLRPEPRDPHPTLGGMYCTGSSSTDGEAKMSRVRATYKGLIKNQIRPAKRSVTCDTRQDSITLPSGAGGSSGDPTAASTLSIQGIPVPNPVYTLRGASASEPDKTQEGKYFQNPSRAPDIAQLVEVPVVAYASGQSGIIVVLQYKPNALGWLCDKIEYEEAALHYEVTVQYRMDYRLSGTRAATSQEQQNA